MKFWRAEFGPKCMGEAFDKKYAYGVRYNYAKEGKRTDYTPYSCMKIIQTPVPKVCSYATHAAIRWLLHENYPDVRARCVSCEMHSVMRQLSGIPKLLYST